MEKGTDKTVRGGHGTKGEGTIQENPGLLLLAPLVNTHLARRWGTACY